MLCIQIHAGIFLLLQMSKQKIPDKKIFHWIRTWRYEGFQLNNIH